jgi:NDP-sugar pyrophosphorylase family protein
MRAVILAGGKGTRLLPYTTILPKPLMPIDQRPVVEIVIRQLQHHGFDRVTLALGHLAHLIQAVLGDGQHLQVQIDYSLEAAPMGTSGPLSLIKDLEDTFLVMNGDVLSDIDFSDVLRFHREQQATATIAVHRRKVHIDYGVLRRDGFRLLQYQEKPTIDYEVSTGIYMFQRKVVDYVTPYSYLDFPELVQVLINQNERVVCYPFDGVWFDLGRVQDFQHVQDQIDHLKNSIPFLD